MKKLSILFALAAFTGIASASPYIVYSGWIGGSNLPGAGSDNSATQVYVATDVNNTTNFAVLMINPTQKTYSVIGRPSDSPASDEATNNFLGAIGTGRSASAVFTYSIETTDSSSDSVIARAYATGPLATATLTLAPARRALSVPIVTNRVTSGTYTFAASPTAITTGGTSYASSFSGTSFGYAVSTSGEIVHATTGGTIQLVFNPSLSGLANIGGAYALSGANQMAVMPISIANGQSESDALVAWLSAYAQANGNTSPTSTNVNAFTGGVTVDGGSLSLSGAISDGVSFSIGTGGASGDEVSVGSSGTLRLGGSNTVGAIVNGAYLNYDTNAANTANGSGALVLGAVGTGSTTVSTGSSTLGFNITGGSGTATLTIFTNNVFSTNVTGSTTLSGSTIVSGTTGSGGNGTLIIIGGGTLTSATGSVTIASTSGGTATGTLSIASSVPGLSAGLSFANTTLFINGSNDLSSITPGTAITGSITLSGGTEASGTYSSGTLTITTP